MKQNIDDLVREDMNKEQQLPAAIRSAFDQSYAQIRQQSKKKTKKSWLKPVSAVAAAIALSTTVLLTNDTAFAKLQAFLGLSDSGIEIAAMNGDVQNLAQVQQNENITMTLENLFVDAYRFGLQFTMDSKDISADDLNKIEFAYRLFDAQGNEISALISDTKPYTGKQVFSGMDFKLTDVSDNRASVEMIATANQREVPSLEGARLVIETIHISSDKRGMKSINGHWEFDLTSPTIVKQQYIANNTVPGLTLNEAIVTNGSMHITFTINETNVGETIAHDTALINEKGEAFYASGNSFKEFEQKTEISLVFPYSVRNEQQALSLQVKDYEELNLINKE
ncbi:DUF4179 domain-containing protein [Solibacillus sp. FSL K6-1554]|uniref:DUF4179 domain-containing protein n=1 Tax=Solibacillus sp. FSL K6-1554 TaxID=2921472 RepID=UPI0030F63335